MINRRSASFLLALSFFAAAVLVLLFADPGFSGRVEIEIGRCSSSGDSAVCLRSLASGSLAETAFSEIIALPDSFWRAASVSPYCYEFFWGFGERAYGRAGSLVAALEEAVPDCGGGFFHGVVSVHLASLEGLSRDPIQRAGIIASACAELTEAPRRLRSISICYQGVGHALMLFGGGDLRASLRSCDVLTPPDPVARNSCYSGAFAEGTAATRYGALPAPSFVGWDPCASFPEEHQFRCYLSFGADAFRQAGNFSDAFAACDPVPLRLLGQCYAGVSFGAFRTDRKRPGAAVARVCHEAAALRGPLAELSCIEELAPKLIALDGGDPTRALRFCVSFSGKMGERCRAVAGSAFGGWRPWGIEPSAFCSPLRDETAVSSCLTPRGGGE